MSDAVAPPPGPLELLRTAVRPEWLDYNGHMNVAYYMVVFDHGTDALLDRLGVGQRYRRATARSVYVLEAHLTYESEVKEGEVVRVTSQLIAADEKRLHVFHRMFREQGGDQRAALPPCRFGGPARLPLSARGAARHRCAARRACRPAGPTSARPERLAQPAREPALTADGGSG